MKTHQQKQLPKYFIDDLKGIRTVLFEHQIVLREMREEGYEYTYSRWGKRRRSTEQLLIHFKNATSQEIWDGIKQIDKRDQEIGNLISKMEKERESTLHRVERKQKP